MSRTGRSRVPTVPRSTSRRRDGSSSSAARGSRRDAGAPLSRRRSSSTEAAGGSTETFADDAREALADAGDRALALNAYEAAARFFRVALDLAGADERRHGPLLFRLGRVLALLGETDFDLLQEARDELLAAGDVEGAADAETRMVEEHWLHGDRDAAMTHLAEARRLVEPLPSSQAKARATATASRLLMLAAHEEDAIRVGEEALAMATDLGLDEIRAAALINIGAARGALGDQRGLAEIVEGVQIARSANAMFEMCRGIGNLSARQWARGELLEAVEGWRQAGREAEEYGQKGFARWFRGVLARWEYELGDWDASAARADAFLDEVEQGSPHYLASECYSCRALIRLARGDGEGAIADAELALELGHRAQGPAGAVPLACRSCARDVRAR